MHPVSDFFGGAFLCNALPHLLSGLQGQPFPTPFAQPRGVGHSSPTVNVLWGAFNLAASLALFVWHPIAVGLAADFGFAALGFLLLGLFCSLRFGQVMADRARPSPSSL